MWIHSVCGLKRKKKEKKRAHNIVLCCAINKNIDMKNCRAVEWSFFIRVVGQRHSQCSGTNIYCWVIGANHSSPRNNSPYKDDLEHTWSESELESCGFACPPIKIELCRSVKASFQLNLKCRRMKAIHLFTYSPITQNCMLTIYIKYWKLE